MQNEFKSDYRALFAITDNGEFSNALYNILNNQCTVEHATLPDPATLNHTQKTLFLCMHLKNAGQADSILTFLQEWYPQSTTEVVDALNEIGAIRSAEIIKQAIELLPQDGTWFLVNADENQQKLMRKLDSEFSNYPDGFLRDLYRKYADAHRNDF